MNGQLEELGALKWLVVFLILAASVGGSVAESILLKPMADLGAGGASSLRELDIAENAYAPSYNDAYDYSQAQVTVEFVEAGDATFRGHLSASNLRPNFAYQLKLLGKPTGLWGAEGDDDSNENLGYAGRWWRVQPNPGNAMDSEYEANHDDPDYIYEGYILFDFFLSDRFGAAELDFALDSSYHVLYWTHQQSSQPGDGPPKMLTVTGAEADEAYNVDLVPTEVGVFGQIERLSYGETQLPREPYNCRIVITEESFHRSGGPPNPMWASRSGLKFQRDGGDFYYAGDNCYYLMVYAANLARRDYVDEVLEESKAMGLNVLRTWAFNDGADEEQALQTSPGVYDEETFVGLDYVVARAGELGLQLILAFVNNWFNYGGMDQYVEWSATANSHDDFYTDSHCRQWYQDHVATVLNRVNTFTGVAYKSDPTIFAWNLVNEPECSSDTSGDTLQEWIETMAAYVKSIDSQHMLTTGSQGYYGPFGPSSNPRTWMNNMGVDFVRNHAPDEIDFACFHNWAPHWNLSYQEAMDWTEDHIEDAETYLDKPVILEEFGHYRPLSQRDQFYQGWYDTVYDGAAAGSAAGGSNFWILYHDDYSDYDGFGVYYPDDISTVTIIETEARRMRDLSSPIPEQGNWISVMSCDTLVFDLSEGLDLPPGSVDSLKAVPGDAEIDLSWIDPGDGDLESVEIWRALWHDGSGGSAYPEYDDLFGNEIPESPEDQASAEADSDWTLAATIPAETQQFSDPLPQRGIYFYQAFAMDEAMQYGPGSDTPVSATSYLLGDVAEPWGTWSLADVNLLGASYGLADGQTGYLAAVDVGPTNDGSGQGLPLTDDLVNFEDLMIFSLNYGDPSPPYPPTGRESLARLALRPEGPGAWVLTLADPGSGIRGLRLWSESGSIRVLELEAGELMLQVGPRFLANADPAGLDVGLALLEPGRVLDRGGEILRLRLSAEAEIDRIHISARDGSNAHLPVELSVEGAPPARLSVGRPHPNPCNASTELSFELVDASLVRCEILDLAGRRCWKSSERIYPPGRHRLALDLRNSSGSELASGLYLYRFQAGGMMRTGKLVLLK